MVRGKKGDEGSPTGLIIILVIAGIFLFLFIAWMLGAFSTLGNYFGLTKGYTLEAIQQKCELAVNNEFSQDYCYFYQAQISGEPNKVYINCEYKQINDKLGEGISLSCAGEAKAFCDRQNASLKSADFKKIKVSNDAGVIVLCSSLAGVLPTNKNCNDPIINGEWKSDCQGVIEYTEFAADKAQYPNKKCCIAGTIAV